MSASDKKKLRKEQAADILSQKQRQQQAEDKKLKIYTISFIAAMALIVCIALVIVGVRAVNQSGIAEKNTIAVSVGDRELNSVEMNYYLVESFNKFYNEMYEQYTSYTDMYLGMMGFDTTKPMNAQMYDAESNKTWADYFLEGAVEQAKNDFALYDLASKENFELPEDERTALENTYKNLETYAKLYGYSNVNKYLSAMYGYGASMDTYKEYAERSAIAAAFYNAHQDSLTYDNAALREYESTRYNNYNSYNYSSCYLVYTEFAEGGKEDEETGEMIYSDEEKAAARAAMEAAVKELATATTLDELKEKSKDVKVNENSQVSVNDATNMLHTDIGVALAEWLAADERKVGEIGAVANNVTTTDAEGKETTELAGYYVVYFAGKDENKEPLANVRHLLVKFEGGTTDEETNETVYSDEEKNAAKTKAEEYLKTWTEGEKTEESFIELIKEHSEDTSAEEGGLFEDIHQDSEYVPEFRNWAIDPERKAGDAEVIETEFGYHVMYYVGADETTYRDFMIENDIRTEDQEEWYNGVLEPVTTELKDTSKLLMDMVLSAG